MTLALHDKYRPQNWDEVIGQGAVVKALQGVIDRCESQAYLLTGPAGCGKTTLARIAAYELGCDNKDILEIDAATYTGIDAMRKVQEGAQYKPFGKSERKAIIIDEAHGLSRQAWDSLLKVVEEPPQHVFWFFCTTNPAKVPVTIKTRCTTISVKPVGDKDLINLCTDICALEKIKLPKDIVDLVVKEAKGSPRQMLVNLSLCREEKNKAHAAKILRAALESDPAIQLARFLIDGNGNWATAMLHYSKLEEESPESVRITIFNYITGALKNAKNDREACHFISILDAFSANDGYDNAAALILSIGRALFVPKPE